MGNTKIEWSQKVWNPVRGCTRVSPGCEHCYAERQSARFIKPGQYAHGFAERTPSGGSRWTGKLALIPEKLGEPLSWKQPALVFVNSMSDLFHERLSNRDIAAVFAIMAACPQHTFQVLTKRAARLPQWFDWLGDVAPVETLGRIAAAHTGRDFCDLSDGRPWPLPNVWLGVSVEDQKRANERVLDLLQTPAAVRFLSCEPLLGPLDLRSVGDEALKVNALNGGWEVPRNTASHRQEPRVHWVICGGESGPGARPMDISWMRSLQRQCEDAGVPYFAKQLGARPVWDGCAGPGQRWPAGTRYRDNGGVWEIHLEDRKGGDLEEWPADMRVREMPLATC